jgi:hypothetical protein
MRRLLLVLVLVLCALPVACDDNTDLSPAPHDAGVEAATDAGSDAGDSGAKD